YQQLVEQAADGIFTINLQGEILYANRAARDLLRLPAKQVLGKHFMIFLDRESRQRAKRYFSKVKLGDVAIRDNLHIRDSLKRVRPIEFTASPVAREKKVVQFLVSVRDISEREQLEAIARESAKMSAVQNFISGTTHEIHYPLEGLVKQIDKLIKLYKAREFEYIGYKEYVHIFETLENMRDQAQYCFDTTDRLINISKRKIGLGRNYSDVNKVVRESLLSVRDGIIRIDGTISTRLSPRLPPAAIGEIELGQVIIKVLTNSLQAVNKGGRVEVRTSYLKKSNQIRIECLDDGIGISRDDLARVFDPFFTTKERGIEKSSGLGLAIAYSIIKSFQGGISITSNRRSGTRVKLLLPIYNKPLGKK
ncbi:MAG: PAS domain S-box protein, partial [Candidatus Omnitrophica bacterium]|nr:PAS domain S-box protein [Candidatus Omnitrophota bacterium]